MLKLIGFSGKMGSGKTTAALHAVETFGGTKIAFADALKEEVEAFLVSAAAPYERRHIWGTVDDKAEECVIKIVDWVQTDYRPRRVFNPHITVVRGDSVSITYRQLMQLWGTEYRRAENPNYWLDKTREKIKTLDGLVLVDDVRYRNEADMIREMGGEVVRVERPGLPESDHISETALDDYGGFSYHIGNDRTIEELKILLDKLEIFEFSPSDVAYHEGFAASHDGHPSSESGYIHNPIIKSVWLRGWEAARAEFERGL